MARRPGKARAFYATIASPALRVMGWLATAVITAAAAAMLATLEQ